jgi:glycosyltransferase involved in cell wall biosynthesis
MRGGEKVLLSLARLFPEAPIYTLLHVPGSVDPELEARDIRTSFVQHLPAAARRYRHYLPLFPIAAEHFDLKGFDLVLSSSHCVAKGVRPSPGALHLCYCHTPMRYVWDRYADYFGPGRVGILGRMVVPAAAAGLRAWDVASAPRVHRFAANSAHVAGRIRRYYGREAEVIPPPVDTDYFTPGPDRPGTYDLVVSALAPYKRVELALEAYRGTGCGRLPDAELREQYRACRAVLMPGVEDFGIVPVEAMACGRPAVVFAEGGGLETVEDGRTGIVFSEPTAPALRDALATLSSARFDRLALRARAEVHRREVFESRVRGFVERALAATDS